MLVLRFRKVESELVVNGKIVEATGVDGVSKVMVLGVALLAVVPGDALGGAEAVARSVITGGALAVALAGLTLAPIDRVAKETFSTLLTMIPSGVMETGATDSLFFILTTLNTSAVTIALAGRTVGKVPSWCGTSVTWNPVPLVAPRVSQSTGSIQRTTGPSLKTFACKRWILFITPVLLL